MEVVAKLNKLSLSPQKARLVIDQIRGKTVEKAYDFLNFDISKAGAHIKKLLDSAVANAENNFGADIDDLFVSKAFVDAGVTLKRMQPRAKGRGSRILKRTSHITVFLSEIKG